MTEIVDFPVGAAQKAVILTRVSSREQEDGHSIDAQKHRLLLYCQRRGLEVLRVFEITESSTRGDRRKFMEMINFCKVQRQTIAIVADKVDRVQRSFKEYPLLDSLIQEGKIELHFNTENYVIHKGSVSQERLMWSFGVIMAQSYVDSLRDNVKRSFDHKIRLGEYPSMAPIGYLNVPNAQGKGDIILDADRATFVRRIFEEFATGAYTLSHITKKVKEWGLRNKTRTKGPLIKSHLYHILTNPFYHGIMVVKGQSYPHRYLPIIDKATFDKCQSVLANWNKKPFAYKNKEFIFRGLVTSTSTGRTVSSFVKKKTYKNGGTGEWVYLQSWDKQGKLMYVREEKLLEQAETALQALQLAPDTVEAVKDYLRATDRSERDFYRRQTDELQREESQLQNRLNGMMDLLMDGAITRAEFDRRRTSIHERQLQITQHLAHNRSGDGNAKHTMLLLLDVCVQAAALFKRGTVEQKRTILNAVFLNLTLDEETLCYSYRVPFSTYLKSAETGKWSNLVDEIRTSVEIRQGILHMAKHLFGAMNC